MAKVLKQLLLTIVWILLLLSTLSQTIEAKPPTFSSVELTQEEKTWLEAHPKIRLAPDPEFLPIEFIDESGHYKGIASDFVFLLKKKLNLPLEVIALKNWDEVLNKTRARQVDMWGAATPTPQRLEYMKFTRPFIELPAVILVRSHVKKSLTLENLKEMKVAVVSGYGIHDHILNQYPEIKLEVVPDISTGLRKVSFGVVDALVSNIGIATYYIEKEGISNLRIAGESGYVYQWGLATRSDWPELNHILDKGILAISEEERRAIYSKWIRPESKTTILEFLQSNAVPLCVLVIIGILISHALLKRKVQEKTVDLRNELNRRQQIEKLLTGYNEVLSSMTQDSDLQVALDRLMNVMQQQSDRMICATMLLDDKGERLFHGSAPSLPAEYIKAVNGVLIGPGMGSCGTAAYRNTPVMVRDISSNPLWKDFKHLALPHGLKACFSIPIPSSKGGVLGTFAIYYKTICDPTPADMEMANSTVQIAKLAIERNQQDQEILRAKIEAEQASQAKSEFLSRMSHEFRTPLNAILGFGQLLELNPQKMNSDQKKYTEMILKGGRHLLELVEEVLDLSRIESRRLELHMESVDLQQTMEEVVSFFQPLTEDNGVSLENKMTGDSKDFIQADLIRLKQVFINLISNAIKFNHHGGKVVLEGGKNCSGRVFVKISDTGLGIPPEKIEEVFEPFVRIEENTPGVEGTGIGLAITKNLVEMMKGTILLESVIDEGSVFTLEFEPESPVSI